MKRILKIAAVAIVAVIFVGTFVYLYQKSQTKPTVYGVEMPKYADIKRTTVLTGSIEPRDKVEIKPQINGIISEIIKEAGDEVKNGDIIAKVKVIPEMEQLNAAENRVRLAKFEADQAVRDYERTKKLYDDKLVSAEEYEKAKLAMDKAQEEMKTANDALQIVREGVSSSNKTYSTTLIRSTIDGLILDVPVKVGNSVIMSNTMNDGTTIATVADMNDLIFKGTVDETEVGLIHEGMPMGITVGALQDNKFTASLEYISPQVVTSTDGQNANQFEIKAAVKVPENVKIRAGYSANAEITLQEAKHVMAVPESCVEFSGDSAFVYVLTQKEPQDFKRRYIKTGLSDGINIEVKGGLKAKEQIRGNAITKDDSEEAKA